MKQLDRLIDGFLAIFTIAMLLFLFVVWKSESLPTPPPTIVPTTDAELSLIWGVEDPSDIMPSDDPTWGGEK